LAIFCLRKPRRSAFRPCETAAGRAGGPAAEWRASLLKALALVEVTIDFADEEVPTDTSEQVLILLKN
jgi:tRNA U34 5-carboxymethylaminomethyl modifying GTPase MnmE/TrmE